MLRVEIVSREDLSRVLESHLIDVHDCSLLELIKRECPSYSPEIDVYLSAYVDGVRFHYDDWDIVRLDKAKSLRIVIEAGGLEAGAIMGIISIIMAVASAVYGIIMANKMTSATQGDTKQGSSIYDVNAQGNKVKLTQVVPENFGFFKHFPDYLADKHVFYRNNQQFMDVILCQGVGYYDYKSDHSDVYVGETPINELDGCRVAIFQPGEVITAANSLEDKCWYCYYSSTEVTASGHTLEPAVSEIDQSSQINPQVLYAANTFSGTYYVNGYPSVGCAGPSSTPPIKKRLDLRWDDGVYFTITGSNNTRAVGSADTITDDPLTGTSSVDVTLAESFTGDNYALHQQWLRARVTEIDPDTQEEVIVSAGDIIKVIVRKITRVTYTVMGGTSGPQIMTAESSDEFVSPCEVLDISYATVGDDEIATVTLDTAEIDVGTYPPGPSVPSSAYDVQTTQLMEIDITQGVPADYPYPDDGMYIINDHDSSTGVYDVSRVSDDYAVISDWVEFWGQGIANEALTFTIDESSSTAGEWVGPYRACPYGAESSIFEYDISFPQGLGYLRDDGTFGSQSVVIEIAYRRAGSSDEWTSVQRTFTDNTNDELAFTFQLETETPGNYEFRMKNLSEESNSTRVLSQCKWIGLKSVISTVNKYDDMTVLICRFKGTETLSELSENQIATYWTRKLPDIHTGELTATDEIAPAIKYICNKSKYAGIINNAALSLYDLRWRLTDLHLNGTVDDDNTLLNVLRDCLNVGFSSPIVVNNKLEFSRLHRIDETLPLSQIFTPQNLTKSPEITFNLPKDDDVDEVVVDYTSPQTYKTETVYCHVDENGDKLITAYPMSVNQEKLTAFGVTSYEQAVAMGMRRLRYLRSTRVTYKIETEYDGLNCQYNDLVGLVLDENISNITGRVTAYDADELTVTTDMEIPSQLTGGIVYIRAMDGSAEQYTYSRIDSHHLSIDRALPEWSDDYGTVMEFPFFAIGEMVRCWVTSVSPADKKVSLTLVNYDEDIFTDDLPQAHGYGISPYGLSPYGIYEEF